MRWVSIKIYLADIDKRMRRISRMIWTTWIIKMMMTKGEGLTWPRGKGPQAASQPNTQVLTPTLHTLHTLHSTMHILHFTANRTKGSPPCAHSSQFSSHTVHYTVEVVWWPDLPGVTTGIRGPLDYCLYQLYFITFLPLADLVLLLEDHQSMSVARCPNWTQQIT